MAPSYLHLSEPGLCIFQSHCLTSPQPVRWDRIARRHIMLLLLLVSGGMNVKRVWKSRVEHLNELRCLHTADILVVHDYSLIQCTRLFANTYGLTVRTALKLQNQLYCPCAYVKERFCNVVVIKIYKQVVTSSNLVRVSHFFLLTAKKRHSLSECRSSPWRRICTE